MPIVGSKFKMGKKGEEEAQEQEFNNDRKNRNDRNDNNADSLLLFDKKVTMAVEGLEPFFEKILRKMDKKDAFNIVEYINTARREINISDGHIKSNIQTLSELSKFHLLISTRNSCFKECGEASTHQYIETCIFYLVHYFVLICPLKVLRLMIFLHPIFHIAQY